MIESTLFGTVQENTEQIIGFVEDLKELTGDIVSVVEIVGDIYESLDLVGELSEEKQMACDLQLCDNLTGDVTIAFSMQTEQYVGDYDVIPKIQQQELRTKHKYMTDDVKVHAIPYFEVGNNGGGTTVYIADEIEME